MTDLKSSLSPLIECPCTDRITKSTVQVSSILTNGKCKAAILDEQDCKKTLDNIGINVNNFTVIHDSNLPSGCSVNPKAASYEATFNTANTSKTCGDISDVGLQGTIKLDEVSTKYLSQGNSKCTLKHCMHEQPFFSFTDQISYRP